MAISLPLDKMSVEEKIQVMESIWADLCGQAEGLSSPDWHADILADRDAAVEAGTDQVLDWELAKTDIKNRTE